MTNSVHPEQTVPIAAVWYWSTLFASILKFVSNVRQLFAADDFSRRHFQIHFSWRFKGFISVFFSNELFQKLVLQGFACCRWRRPNIVGKSDPSHSLTVNRYKLHCPCVLYGVHLLQMGLDLCNIIILPTYLSQTGRLLNTSAAYNSNVLQNTFMMKASTMNPI